MKKMISLIGTITLVGTSTTSLISCDDNSTGQQKNNISDVISNTNLGNIVTNFFKIPNKLQIFLDIKSINSKAKNLTTNDFEFKTEPTSTKATIVGEENYTGEVTLNYNCLIDINSIFLISNLGVIQTSNDNLIPSKQEVYNMATQRNLFSSILTESDFNFKSNPTSTMAVIMGLGKFAGEVIFNYTTEKQ